LVEANSIVTLSGASINVNGGGGGSGGTAAGGGSGAGGAAVFFVYGSLGLSNSGTVTNTFGSGGSGAAPGTTGGHGGDGQFQTWQYTTAPVVYVPTPPSVGTINANPAQVSSGGTSILTATGDGGGWGAYTYNWFTGSGCSGTAIPLVTGSTYTTPALYSSATYSYKFYDSFPVVNQVSACSAPVTVTVPGASCTAPSPGADWSINCADNCVETTASSGYAWQGTSVGTLNLYGTGTAMFQSYNIIATGFNIASTCHLYLDGKILWSLR
jgi:hypothetical protein